MYDPNACSFQNVLLAIFKESAILLDRSDFSNSLFTT